MRERLVRHMEMEGIISNLLGPSNFLLVLDLFLECPCQWMNLREIARRVGKNPGSISPVMSKLVERGLILDCKVGIASTVYQLNFKDKNIQALLTLRETLKKTGAS